MRLITRCLGLCSRNIAHSSFRFICLFSVSISFIFAFYAVWSSATVPNITQCRELPTIFILVFFRCTHCQQLSPELDAAADQLATKNQFVFAKVSCSTLTLPCNCCVSGAVTHESLNVCHATAVLVRLCHAMVVCLRRIA